MQGIPRGRIGRRIFCRISGCGRPRSPHSAFCGTHHGRLYKYRDPDICFRPVERLGLRKAHPGAYSSWLRMKNRCTNLFAKEFRCYGAKGITFDPRWERFSAFLEDVGDRPAGCCLHRLDGKRGYTRDNVAWMDRAQHARLHGLEKRKVA
ncbi:MAG: hypothetical protein ABSG85_16815 [Spirochaetia bacterium]